MPTKKKTAAIFSASNLKRVFPDEDPAKVADLLNRVDMNALLARDPNMPPMLLALLASDTRREVLGNLARNPSTPPKTLTQLAKNIKVRFHVAGNPSTPDGTLGKLASDSNEDVRMEVARNLSTPYGTLRRIAKDKTPQVREFAMFMLDVRSGRRKMWG